MADARLADAATLLDGLSAFERFWRLNKLYVAYLAGAEDSPSSDERRTLLELVQSALALVESADLFLEGCDERTQRAKGPEFDRRLQALLGSEPFRAALASHPSGQDLPALIDDGARRSRDLLAQERMLLEQELAQLRAGQPPVRAGVTDEDVSAIDLLAGAALAGAGAAAFAGAAAASAAAAPKVAVAMIAVGGVALEAAAITTIVHAVTE